MKGFGSPEGKLIVAMQSKQTNVKLGKCFVSLDNIFKNVLHKEPRLLAYLSGYSGISTSNGFNPFMHDYDIIIKYSDYCPESLDDVIVDNGEWKVSTVFCKENPKEVIVITSDLAGFYAKCNAELQRMLSCYEGICGWHLQKYSIETFSNLNLIEVTYTYVLPIPQLRLYQNQGIFAAKNIWKKILGKSKVPDFVKPFLAFSYLTQECCYDQRALDEVERNQSSYSSDCLPLPTDPIPHIAYGPLVESRGICGGLAWAFKTLMDVANIECICVGGYLKEDSKLGHIWNLVKLDGQYYHLDPSCGIKNEGVYVNELMQPDIMMKTSHIWEYSKYPQAKGLRFDYDFVEEFLVKNGREYLGEGANEKYFFPDKIVE